MNPASELDATYYGFIGSTYDALILFEACIAGQMKHVSRRPHDLERERVIQSGSIFIYEESTSGIKRWTDGISWSPSRILGNFLVYRQLVKALRTGEKKKAIKRPKPGPNGITKNNISNNDRNDENPFQVVNSLQASGLTYGRAGVIEIETERALIGSLTDSYDFLENGLVKKTISVHNGDVTHHLVSYYTISDATSQKFMVPSKDPRLAGIHPRLSLLTSQNFRNTMGDVGLMGHSTHPRNRYEMTNRAFPQHRTPPTPILENYSNKGDSVNKMYSSNYNNPSTSSACEHALPSYKSSGSCTHRRVAALYTHLIPQRSEHHQEQYFGIAGSSTSESSHVLMPSFGILQRNVSFHNRGDLEDSTVSTSRQRATNDSAFTHGQTSLCGFPRSLIPAANYNTIQRAAPSSSHESFADQVVYGGFASDGVKHCVAITKALEHNSTWQSGNASIGHGHYQDI